MKMVQKMQFLPHPARKTTGQPGQPCPSKSGISPNWCLACSSTEGGSNKKRRMEIVQELLCRRWKWCQKCSFCHIQHGKQLGNQGNHAHPKGISPNWCLPCSSWQRGSTAKRRTEIVQELTCRRWKWCQKCSFCHIQQGKPPGNQGNHAHPKVAFPQTDAWHVVLGKGDLMQKKKGNSPRIDL